MADAMASNKTAPAARSLVRLIASSYSADTRSARASIAELTASNAKSNDNPFCRREMEQDTCRNRTYGSKTVYPCIVFPTDKQENAVKGILETSDTLA